MNKRHKQFAIDNRWPLLSVNEATIKLVDAVRDVEGYKVPDDFDGFVGACVFNEMLGNLNRALIDYDRAHE